LSYYEQTIETFLLVTLPGISDLQL